MKGQVVRTVAWSLAVAMLALFVSAEAATKESAEEDASETESQEAADQAPEDAATEDETFLSEDGAASEDESSASDSESDDKKENAAKGEKWGGRLRDHAKQGVVNISGGTGYFFVAPYDKNDPDKMCQRIERGSGSGNEGEGEPVCGGRSGWFMEFLGGYGLKPGFELLAIFRLGLEQPDNDGLLNQPKVRQFGLGLKFYKPNDGLFKLSVGIAPLFDFSDRGDGPKAQDLVIHVPILGHFDIFPWFGAYLQAGVNVSFIAEFRFEITGSIGVQGRFP